MLSYKGKVPRKELEMMEFLQWLLIPGIVLLGISGYRCLSQSSEIILEEPWFLVIADLTLFIVSLAMVYAGFYSLIIIHPV